MNKPLRFGFVQNKHRGLAGILSAVIMFAAIFSTGFGFFLFVNTGSQNANQANLQRANLALQGGSEKLLIAAHVTPASGACSQCLWVRANNTGGVSSTIIDVYVTCESNCPPASSGQLLTNSLVNPGSHFLRQSPLDLNVTLPLTLGIGASTRYQSDIRITKGAMILFPLAGEHVVVSLLTSLGNVFTAQYPPPPLTSTTFVTVKQANTTVGLKQLGGGPQLSVLLSATAACPGGGGGCTQTFSCSNGCITVTATIYNLATTTASGVSLTLHTPYSDFISGTASVSVFSACTPATQNIASGGQGTVTCQFNAHTGATGGLASFSGTASGTLSTVLVTSATALSNSIEIGGIASVTTQGAFAANFFFLKYSSCFQNAGGNFNAPCTTNVSPVTLSSLPSGSYISAGSNYYVAFYMQITNVFNTTLPLMQYSYTFGDPTISGEVYYFLAGSATSETNGVYYPNYSGTPTLVGYPTNCNTGPTPAGCITVAPGQTVTLTFAACGFGSTTFAWAGQQDAQGGGGGCTGNSPNLSVPEGMVLGIIVSFVYKGTIYSELMPFQGQAYLRSTMTTLSCSPVYVVSGSSSTCTATVTDTDGGSTISPTGTVSFSANPGGTGSFTTSTCTLSSGSCSVVFNTLASAHGAIAITANYLGDSYHGTSTATQTINAVNDATTTTVACVPNSLPVNTATTCTATVKDTSALPTTPTGNVGFTSAGGTFSPTSCILAGGGSTATCTSQFTPSPGKEGSVTVTATYVGDAGHGSSTGSTTVTANKRASSISVTCVPANVGQFSPSTCTATVTDTTSGTKVTPTGTATFSVNPSGKGSFSSTTCTLSAGACSVQYTPSVKSGVVSITATYGGDTDHTGSGPSAGFTITATIATPTLTVSCNPVGITTGSTSTCTATLTNFASPVTGETITWSQSGAGALTLPSPATCGLSAGGTCSITVTGNTVGTVTLKGSYPGDASNQATTGTQVVTVKGPAHLVQSANLCVNPSSSTCTGSLGSSVNSGDVIVVVVSTTRVGHSSCATVQSISGTRGDASYTAVPSASVTASDGSGSSNCAYSIIMYATVTSSGTDTITVTLTHTPDNGIISVIDINSVLLPPTGANGLCTSSCTTSLATSSLAIPANSFVVATASECPNSGGTMQTVNTGPSLFTIMYGTTLDQYVGFQVPAPSGSQTFTMTGSGASQCWSEVGAEFPDPPASPSHAMVQYPSAPQGLAIVQSSSLVILGVCLLVAIGAIMLFGKVLASKKNSEISLSGVREVESFGGENLRVSSKREFGFSNQIEDLKLWFSLHNGYILSRANEP